MTSVMICDSPVRDWPEADMENASPPASLDCLACRRQECYVGIIVACRRGQTPRGSNPYLDRIGSSAGTVPCSLRYQNGSPDNPCYNARFFLGRSLQGSAEPLPVHS